MHERVEKLLEISEGLRGTNLLRGRQIKDCAKALQRKIDALESHLKDINALYMKALDKINAVGQVGYTDHTEQNIR
jgi:hypothetical protein